MSITNGRSQSPLLTTSRRLKRAAAAGLITIAVVGSALLAWNYRTTRRLAREVGAAIDAGRIDAAEQALKQYLTIRHDSGEGLFLSARLAWAEKRPEDALADLRKARERGYPEPPMQRLLGLIYARSGRPRDAEPLLLSAWAARRGADPDVADALCQIDFETNRLGPAMDVIRGWIADTPGDLRPLLWKAVIHSRNDAGAEAQVKDFDAILAIDPDQHASRLARADALRQLGKLGEAKADYDLYIRARPDDPMGHIGAAKTLEGLDDEDGALDQYEKALAADPDSVLGLLGKASILIRRKAADRALPLIDRAIAREPNDPEGYYRRGQALDRLGRIEEAKASFATHKRYQDDQKRIETIRRGLVRDPNHIGLMYDAASWLLAHGNDEEGLSWAKLALDKSPRHAPTLDLLVSYYTRKGDPGRANFYRSQRPGK